MICVFFAGTEDAFDADAHAMEWLQRVARLVSDNDNNAEVLEAFHNARDQHIFRILATLSDPTHTSKARRRALDELPKRTKSLGDAVVDWTKQLVRRCAMGSSLNASVIRQCVVLAQEALKEDDVVATAALVSCVQTTTEIFPALCASSFETLTDIFSECRAAGDDIKKELEESGVVTALSAILSATVASGKVSMLHALSVILSATRRVGSHPVLFLFVAHRLTSRTTSLSAPTSSSRSCSKCAPATARPNKLGMPCTPCPVSLVIQTTRWKDLRLC